MSLWIDLRAKYDVIQPSWSSWTTRIQWALEMAGWNYLFNRGGIDGFFGPPSAAISFLPLPSLFRYRPLPPPGPAGGGGDLGQFCWLLKTVQTGDLGQWRHKSMFMSSDRPSGDLSQWRGKTRVPHCGTDWFFFHEKKSLSFILVLRAQKELDKKLGI